MHICIYSTLIVFLISVQFIKSFFKVKKINTPQTKNNCSFENAVFSNENDIYLFMGITKPCTHLHPALSTSTQLISASTQLSVTPSIIFEPKYCT